MLYIGRLYQHAVFISIPNAFQCQNRYILRKTHYILAFLFRKAPYLMRINPKFLGEQTILLSQLWSVETLGRTPKSPILKRNGLTLLHRL